MSESDLDFGVYYFERIREENNYFTNKTKVHKSMKRVQVSTVRKDCHSRISRTNEKTALKNYGLH